MSYGKFFASLIEQIKIKAGNSVVSSSISHLAHRYFTMYNPTWICFGIDKEI